MNQALLAAELSAQNARTGAMPAASVEELRKALEAGYGTDVASLTGGGALRIQSLEATLLSTIAENKHFRLFNKLPKTNAGATVDEWTEQNSVGGFLGGSTNTELGTIAAATGGYQRRTGMVKYLMARREVSFVATLQNSIAEAEAIEQQNGTIQLLQDAEFLSFEGDQDVVPTEFDGIHKLVSSLGSTDHVLDAEGGSLENADLIMKAAATIAGFGNFGMATDIFVSNLVQSDLDAKLDPAWRVSLENNPNSVMLGTPVRGIRTSWGDIATQPDVFIRDEGQQKPFEIDYPSVAAENTFSCASVPTGVTASDVSSKFGAKHAGNYYYAVAGVNAKGQSVISKSAQIAVAAGDKVTLTITASTSGAETGYVIYRSRKNGTNATSDFRQCARVAKAGATTTWVDLNRDIPGTSKAYILNMSQGALAITWRQLLPMLKFPLYPTDKAVVPWAQLLFGYLRMGKRRHHVVIKNIVPTGAVWKPFA